MPFSGQLTQLEGLKVFQNIGRCQEWPNEWLFSINFFIEAAQYRLQRTSGRGNWRLLDQQRPRRILFQRSRKLPMIIFNKKRPFWPAPLSDVWFHSSVKFQEINAIVMFGLTIRRTSCCVIGRPGRHHRHISGQWVVESGQSPNSSVRPQMGSSANRLTFHTLSVNAVQHGDADLMKSFKFKVQATRRCADSDNQLLIFERRGAGKEPMWPPTEPLGIWDDH